MISRLRDGTPVETYDGEGRVIDLLYGTGFGRMMLRPLVAPWVSKLAGAFLDCRISSCLVGPFVRKNNLDLRDYPRREYHSFNDFFTRSILPGKRQTEPEEDRLASPCDGKLTLFPLEEDTRFTIKGCQYTVGSLLQNEELAREFKGGWGILLRLTVDDYHRYSYPVSGEKGENIPIPGVYHTVNPRAAEARPIYCENSRQYTRIHTESFGSVVMMEIGALLVGRIKNHHGAGPVARGQEKGYFEFGGSSIMLLLEKGHFTPDADLLENSQHGEETVIHLGEGLGNLS